MAKIFFDIVPPNMASRQESESQPIIGNGKIKVSKKDKKSLLIKEVLISVIIFVGLLGVFFYFKLPRLDLKIWPKIELLTFEKKITIDKSAGEIDFLNGIIPGKILEEEKELWQEFPATGINREEGKAEGVIRVYNKYNPPVPITLIANTRFLSDSEKSFRSFKKIYIPAAKIKSGKIIPSWTETRVVAIEAGKDYNIKPAEFSIPKLAGTSYYYTIYGKSTAPMIGGFETESKQITQEDIQKAKDVLAKKLLASSKISLKSKVPSGFILFNDAISGEIIEVSPFVKAGAVVEQFNVQAKAKTTALIFKKSDLEKIAEELILSELPVSKKLFKESLSLNYTPELINLEKGEITLSLKFSAKIYPAISEKELSTLLRGKSNEEIREVVYKTLPQQVSQIEINFWPFWVKKTPKNLNKINVELNLE